MIYEVTDTHKVSALFGKWEEPMIWSCLQGVMGKIYADNLNNPQPPWRSLAILPFLPGNPIWNSYPANPHGVRRTL